MASHIFKDITNRMEQMFRLHVTKNAGLSMQQLLHLEEPMTLQHLERLYSVKLFKSFPPKNLWLAIMHKFALKLY